MSRHWMSAAALAIAAAGGPPAGASEAPRVVAVELRADAPISAEGLRDLVAVEPGAALDREAVRRTLRNLQASGVAGAVDALTVPVPGGIRVVLALRSLVRVEEVAIEGELGVRRIYLESALAQTEAAPLSENRVLRGVYRLQDLYWENGYRRAAVRVAVETEGRRARVVYRVEAGPRTTVSAVRFTGLPSGLEADRLISGLRLQPGDGLSQSRVEDDVERVEAMLREEGFRAARVAEPVEVDGPEPDTLELEYRITAGPRVRLAVLGFDEAKLSRRGLLEVFDSQTYDETLLLQTVRAIRRDFQQRGHYRARVESSVEEREGEIQVDLLVQPGPVYELAELAFSGNQWASAAALAIHVETTVSRALRAGTGRLVDDRLAEDLDNLRSFYALQGFPQARIGPPEVTETGSRLAVRVPIEEGPRQQVVDMSFEGLAEAAVDLEIADLPLVSGGPFHPALLEETLEEVRAAFEAAGYLSARVSSKLERSDDGRRVDVHLRVLAGPRALVDRVIVRGNQRTDTGLVRRTLELEPGALLTREGLLEAQRRLYRLGIFSRAEVRMAPASPFASRRDVLVRLTEGSARRLTYGVGYDSEDGLRGLFGYSHANLLGRGVSARFDLRLSSRERQARFLLRQPYLGKLRLPVTYSLFGIDEDQQSFESRRRGVQVEAERRRAWSRFGLLYTYKAVEVKDADPALEPLEIERELREVEISSLTPSFFVDRRDDPLLPTRGWTAGVQAEYAFPLFDAESEFVKVFAQHSRYLPLGRFGVVAGSLRLGAIEPQGSGGIEDPTLPPELDSRLIPISERFFAGGRNSHRAYRRDRLGITAETLLEVAADSDPTAPAAPRLVPVGGNGLVLANLDYRFPVAGPLGGTAFVDLGNVWGSWRDIDPNELKLGAGLGLRYLSPIGPLRLEVGWKLDREPGERPAVLFLSFGNPF